MVDWLNEMTTDVEPATPEQVIRSFDRRLRKIKSKHLFLRGKHWKTVRYFKRKLIEQRIELEACAEKNQDKKDKIEAIIKLVNEYRYSGDHTLARAHITLYKIDMDILSVERGNSIYSDKSGIQP